MSHPVAAPLEGVRIVDLTSMVSGPLATGLLADQGADVVKVEAPGGDLIRHVGTSRGGSSAIFNTCNRGKRSVVLNLKAPPGLAALHKLVARADVFVENFRPGVAERMGLSEPGLRRLCPELIYVSIRGFGERGPYAQRRVYDVVIQALSGMAASQADPSDGHPTLVRNIVCDKVTALHAAQAISAALFARERGHGGTRVSLSMLDASIAFLWPDVMERHTYLGGDDPGEAADLSGILRAHATRDGWVALLAISDAEFEGLARALGRPELLADPRFSTIAARMAHADELAAQIRDVISKLTTLEICQRLEAEGVPAARVNDAAEVFSDPQVVANELLVAIEDARYGAVRMPRPVVRFGETTPRFQSLAPQLGEHTDEVLGELGIAEDELEALRVGGAAS